MKACKKGFSVLLIMTLCFIMVFMGNGVASAEIENISFDGYTPISTKEELNQIRNDLDGKYYLTCDIVFTEEDFEEGGEFYNGGKGWSPISSFNGVFDGNGYAVKGIKIEVSNTRGGSYGLFGSNSGTICNLGVGAGVIKVESSDKGASISAGGIAGANQGTIKNCYNTNKLIVTSWSVDVGGIVGLNGGTSEENKGIISLCYNMGTINATASTYSSEGGGSGYVGGIAGYANGGNGDVSLCYNGGDITLNVLSTGGTTNLYGQYNANAKAYAGGIANAGDVTNCYNTGEVEANAKAKVQTFGAKSEAYAYVGGISGICGDSVSSCYNVGRLFAESMALDLYGGQSANTCIDETYVGGMIGMRRTDSEISNCYYLNLVDRGIGEGTDAGNKLTEMQFKVPSNLIGFDFETTWEYKTSGEYDFPILTGVEHLEYVVPVVVPDSAKITEDGKFWYEVRNYTNGTSGAILMKYIGTDVDVVIPETIEGYKVHVINDSAFEDCRVQSIKGESIETIGFSAFKNCRHLVSIDFPNAENLYSNDYTWNNGKLIANNPFENCKNLTKIELPSVTGISAYTFLGCKNLKTLVLPSLKTVWPHSFNLSMNEDGSEPPERSDIENIYIPCKGVSFSVGKDYYEGSIREIHSYGEWTVTKEPTCTEKGSKERTCTLCKTAKEVEDIAIDLNAHSYGEWTVTKEPTCTEKGSKERTCTLCKTAKEVEDIAIDSNVHSFTNYTYNNDATVGKDGTETAVCDNGCGATDTRTKAGTALSGGGSSGGGIDTPSVQKPEISSGDGYTTELRDNGKTAEIVVDEDYELVDVSVNGISKGCVTILEGLKTGDKIVITVISKVEKIQNQLKTVAKENLQAHSKQVKLKNGKKAVKITWTNTSGIDFDGVEIFRSLKRYEGFGTKPIFSTEKEQYYNTAVKKGTRYYYKVRGYVKYDGVKYYSGWSAKAWRTVK